MKATESKETIWQKITILNERPKDMPFEEYKDKLRAQRDLYRMYRKMGISFKAVPTKQMKAYKEAQRLVQELRQKEQLQELEQIGVKPAM